MDYKNFLAHYGIKRKSGRYPWGSGNEPYQGEGSSINSRVSSLKKKGMTETEIAKSFGMTTSELRAKISISKEQELANNVSTALKLKDKGYSNTAIAKKMGTNESNIRSWLKKPLEERATITRNTADVLKDSIKQNKLIDVGSGMEAHLGISKTKLNNAVSLLKEEGYDVYYVKVPQVGVPGNYTSLKVLGKAGLPYKYILENQTKIHSVDKYSEDGGRSFLGLEPIKNISSKRIKVVYGDEGGNEKDGVIELRRGVPELSLGTSRYAQVRIGVDGTHYLKGMAMYSDKMPKGIDILYNTNKKSGTPKEKVFKELDKDTDNPFGAIVRQKHYFDKNGNKHLSALNIVGYKDGSGEEGSWNEWSRTISSQMLSKQSPKIAKRQLDIAYKLRKEQFDEIMKITNPSVKNRLLRAYADECDSAAVDLKAAAFPRQRTHVILPISSLKDNECYAPNYRNGEKLALIRHPHGGKFEIPELTVNNKHKDAKSILGNAKDAIGINKKVADRLSGADFDGDTVLAIPNNHAGIKSSKPLKQLKNFDPKEKYPYYKGMSVMKKGNIGRQMGDISNLITDMTIKGASNDEIARAVKHSMVVIDAHKHKLDYKRSYEENGIANLKEKWQGGKNKGASTLISKSSAVTRIDEVKPQYKIDLKTGKKIFEKTNKEHYDKNGKLVKNLTKTTKMYVTEDAKKLSSGTLMEDTYANYANQLKKLGNDARKESLTSKPTEYSSKAKKTYSKEVDSLNAKLNVALKNAPLERKAQVLANDVIKSKLKENKELKNDQEKLKKIKTQALMEARTRVGAKKQLIDITEKEWEAIQSGAISKTKLDKILNNSDLDKVKKLATPKNTTTISAAKKNKIISMINNGYTYSEIADATGVSISTINNLDEVK